MHPLHKGFGALSPSLSACRARGSTRVTLACPAARPSAPNRAESRALQRKTVRTQSGGELSSPAVERLSKGLTRARAVAP
eukprot:6765853-Pyramimonas_sp.AAC.1